jgi:small subunit ribosomal protein S17e
MFINADTHSPIMGKIRPRYIKRAAEELISRYGDKASKDFEANKELVNAVARVPSKRIRNKIAGYVTHIIRAQSEEPEEEAPKLEVGE